MLPLCLPALLTSPATTAGRNTKRTTRMIYTRPNASCHPCDYIVRYFDVNGKWLFWFCEICYTLSSTGLVFKLIGLYNNYDVLVSSILGTVLAHDTIKGNAFFIFFHKISWSIIPGNDRTCNVGSNRAKIGSCNIMPFLQNLHQTLRFIIL